MRMDASELSKAFFTRNPMDYSVEDNWQLIKAGMMEILKFLKRNWVHGVTLHGSQEI